MIDEKLKYPEAPGWKARDTSVAAAEHIRPTAANIQDQCLRAYKVSGPMTADECANILGMSVLTVRPRISQLSALNQLEDTGIRRKNDSGRNAIVWRVAVGGQREQDS